VSRHAYSRRDRTSRFCAPSTTLGLFLLILIVSLTGAVLVIAAMGHLQLPWARGAAYSQQYEGRVGLAGVVLAGKPISSMWPAGSSPPWDVQSLGENSEVRMLFDPDGDRSQTLHWDSSSRTVSMSKFGYCNVLVEVGDFYEKHESGFWVSKEKVDDSTEYKIEIEGTDQYNVSTKHVYWLETWEFDVMVNFWTSTGEMELLKVLWFGDDMFCSEFALDNEGKVQGPKQTPVTPVVKVEIVPWSKIRGVQNVYAAILNARIETYKFFYGDTLRTKTPLFGAANYNDYDNQLTFEAYLKQVAGKEGEWHSGYLTTFASGTNARCAMFSSIAGQTLAEASMAEAKAISSTARSSAFIALPMAEGMPAFWTNRKTVDAGDLAEVHVVPQTVVCTVQVEVLRTEEFEPTRTKLGGELAPPPHQEEKQSSGKPFTLGQILNPFNWSLKWQVVFWMFAIGGFMVLTIIILTQLGRSPVKMLLMPPAGVEARKAAGKTRARPMGGKTFRRGVW